MNNIVVVGLGAVGLPLALCYALKDCLVYGVDSNQEHLKKIKTCTIDFQEDDNGKKINEIIREATEKGNLVLSTDIPEITQPGTVIMVVVPINVENGSLNINTVSQALKDVGKKLKQGDLVIIRSTVFPGFSEEVALPILERESGMQGGQDFYLAYSPERMSEGKAFEELRNIDLIVGGINQESVNQAIATLRIISPALVHVGKIKEVETSKIIENLQRDVNIALANEISYFLASKGISGKNCIRLANTHKRVNMLLPGPGVGGHCLPWAYYYLGHITRSPEELPLSRLSRQINDLTPQVIVNLIQNYITESSYDQDKIAILGQAWKDYSSNCRHSPAVRAKEILIEKGFQVVSYDPMAKSGLGVEVVNLEDCLENASVVIIPVIQKEFLSLDVAKIQRLIKPEALIIDLKELLNKEELVSAGYKVFSL
ncbi:MAG: UDP-N-acetyl-D-mannosamine dehydrogenase [candidate division WS2 bacterium]|uniref:UDP-N-acetyl-D-mannosamine dehydrogenase n=1 Tax=Psychracetigena formicireducens TaxID=2986056 RepID=A0A9E2F0I1_PSYF1|nr:UDP-N-acetyl-D-mannosamine dehydrogenase [Candidatus Psychracetigena formicireducens]MBT9144374.1 UDP-N-acetyl-D-mannosamine dehydrogenase [Candidatus Psychracetigena formicireducens]